MTVLDDLFDQVADGNWSLSQMHYNQDGGRLDNRTCGSAFTDFNREFLKKCFAAIGAYVDNTMRTFHNKLDALERENKHLKWRLDAHQAGRGATSCAEWMMYVNLYLIHLRTFSETTPAQILKAKSGSSNIENEGFSFIDQVMDKTIIGPSCFDTSAHTKTTPYIDGVLDGPETVPSCFGMGAYTKTSQELGKSSNNGSDSQNGEMSMMICNIPCRVREADLIQAIDSVGFGGTFSDLFFLAEVVLLISDIVLYISIARQMLKVSLVHLRAIASAKKIH
eukprot:CAMPEP_0169387040 /NCGR_PEP_ID=MMETSP1017-20121227/45129_1 /TAXON_ID=342587 /ORGANISM="Karlodinium micrum, Strain CCMP2283" /LENGTH=278 /DNA_ID=CAMNT_0009488399 /DNA_START=54 /DNA_END=890 /DNA_ORIENTATION=-